MSSLATCTALPLALLCAAALSPSAASQPQSPTFEIEPLDLAPIGSGTTPLFHKDFRAGADEGWVGVVELIGPEAPATDVFVGRLSEADPRGAHLLRVPTVIDGVRQRWIRRPTLAGGRVAYMAQELLPSGLVWSAWLDDRRIAGPGDPAGEDGASWAGIQTAYATTLGTVILDGASDVNGVLERRLVEYTPGSQLGTIRLQYGDPVLGSALTVGEITSVAISPDGRQLAARAWLGSHTGILVNGSIHTSRDGSASALEGEPLGTFAHEPVHQNQAWVDFLWLAINDEGDVVFVGSSAGLGTPRIDTFRSGALVRDFTGPAVIKSPIGIDKRGFLASAAPVDLGLRSGLEDLPIYGRAPYVDRDGDGATESSLVVLTPNPTIPSTVISGDGEVHGAGSTLDTSTGSSELVYLRNVRVLGNQTVCSTGANSAGRGARLNAAGSDHVAYGQFSLTAIGLPPRAVAYPIVSRTPGAPTDPIGAAGALCLSGTIGRAVNLAQVARFDGSYSGAVDLASLPQPNGSAAVLPGDTWYAQLWYCDTGYGTRISSFSDAIALSFR